MPRSSRIESPTDYYHVILRGNNKRFIFEDIHLKKKFLTVLFAMEKEELIQVISWCLMSNHVHLIIKSTLADLSKSMSRINTSFAIEFNKHYKTYGHVFQDRYKSEIICDAQYLQHVLRYVHNNPVSAEMVAHPQLYPWSSYNSFIHNRKKYFISEISNLFGNSIEAFIEFHGHEDALHYLDTNDDFMRRSQRLYTRYFKDYCHLHKLPPIKVMLNTYHRNQFLSELKSMSMFNNKVLSLLSNISEHTLKKIK